MKRKLPTILILLVMVLVGAMYWVDLSYYTNPESGFIVRGSLWLRYAIVCVPLLMCLLGLRTIGPRAISVMRVKSTGMGFCMVFAGFLGALYGIFSLLTGIAARSAYTATLGLLTLWYGIWMFFAAIQMFTQNTASPTKSAALGAFAGLPFAYITIYRILINPSSLYRVAPLVASLSALFSMIWVGLLLRALYIALPRQRVRWMYFTGVFTFLFATCLELPYAIHIQIMGYGTGMDLLQSLFIAGFGLVAGYVSVEIAGQSGAAAVVK